VLSRNQILQKPGCPWYSSVRTHVQCMKERRRDEREPERRQNEKPAAASRVGIDPVQLSIASCTVALHNVLHVPKLQMPLFSVRTHCHQGPGCSFIADKTGCWLTFPDLCIEMDDSADCIHPFSYSDSTDTPEYAWPHTICSHPT
jgi:hypothetical protein